MYSSYVFFICHGAINPTLHIVLVQFILFFKSSCCKIASVARNLINSVPQAVATTFAFSSVSILLLQYACEPIGNKTTYSLANKRRGPPYRQGAVPGRWSGSGGQGWPCPQSRASWWCTPLRQLQNFLINGKVLIFPTKKTFKKVDMFELTTNNLNFLLFAKIFPVKLLFAISHLNCLSLNLGWPFHYSRLKLNSFE